jgi:hypothetical protein
MKETVTEKFMEDETESVATWFDYFFDENNIVNTIQNLLIKNDDTIDSLCAFVTAASKSKIIMAFTSEGLVPLAGDHMYVFPFSRMNKGQLTALRREIEKCSSTFSCKYAHEQYLVSDRRHFRIDDATLLFGTACIIAHGLGTTTESKFGSSHMKFESQQVFYYLNTILFRIVHTCCMPQGTLVQSSRLLEKHGVTIQR